MENKYNIITTVGLLGQILDFDIKAGADIYNSFTKQINAQ